MIQTKHLSTSFTMTLSIISINVNGLRDRSKRLKFFSLFDAKKHNIIFIQETHCSDESEAETWSQEWNGYSLWNNGNNKSRGVAVLFRDDFNGDYDITDVWKDENGRTISFSCTLKNNNESYRFSNIYAPNIGNDRKRYYSNLLTHLEAYRYSSQIIGGDFNLAQYNKLDRKKSRETITDRLEIGHQELISLCEILNLEDVWRRRNPQTKCFTFTRKNSSSRIDFFLCSKTIDNEIRRINIIPCLYSDHNFVEISIDPESPDRGPGTWILNASLLEDENNVSLIEQFWAKWSRRKGDFTNVSNW